MSFFIRPTKFSAGRHQLKFYWKKRSDRICDLTFEVMGINFSCSAWAAQVEHFSRKKDHAVLVFDNRGTGNSDAGAIEPYKTSDMAQDTMTLLKWLGWEQDRSIHLFGVSLGGMIAQELCLIIPERFKSTRSFSAVFQTSSRVATGDQALDLYLELLFPDGHFELETEEGKRYKSNLREKLRNCHHLPREQPYLAFGGHFYAAMMHHCSYGKLEKIATDLHPAKILVITGDSDELVLPKRSPELHEHLPGSELIVVRNAGHALPYQISDEFNAIMDRVIKEGKLGFFQALI
ncbi:hypothetical protein PGTUg99_000470 [Puccinia graminis f. sp. tritici]|uniref:AB hydrolase-1 domain-containing protein n=1 Tax=Puccinia graminis f. sp. tritici TaxID=56615 RepID=A0A5B0S969_PUCGR|nr:hypothetical protein PGTUg99_000470 [Puccinia graminis f. sp. tritici]